MKKLFILCALLCSLLTTAVYAEEYQWDNIALGGGGYVVGLLFHPKEEGLVYARTDVGGMYRWDKSLNKWKQLNNGFSRAQENMYGVDGIAIDPNDENVLYMVAGKYWWLSGGVYKSVDRGDNWTKILDIKSSSNLTNRENGECIGVDPYNSNIIYVGTRRQGLYRSDDGGESWTTSKDIKVENIDVNAVRSIVFDPRQGEGEHALAVYASVIGQGVFKSADNGASWEQMEGSPQNPTRMAVNQDGVLFVASPKGLHKFADGQWEDISPQKDVVYKAVACYPDDPNYLLAVANTGNVMMMPVFLSEDGGDTWRDVTEKFSITKQAGYFEDDNFSSSTCCVAIDPFDKKHVLISDWFGIWETQNIEEKQQTRWQQKIRGIEELCPYTAACPPEGENFLLLGVADNDGFPISNIYELQSRKFTDAKLTWGGPRLMSTTDITFCEEQPEIVVRVGITHNEKTSGGYSLDGGNTWNAFDESPFEDNGGLGARVAISSGINADTGFPTILIGQSEANLKISRDMGKTWTENAEFFSVCSDKWDRKYNTLTADKMIHDKFYMYYNNLIYISEDGGTTWTEGSDVEGESTNFTMKTPPGKANELWYTPGLGEGGLYRSTDGGITMKKLRGISNVVSFGFGKAKEGASDPTIFAYATVDQREGIYRSVDYGNTWERIDVDTCKIGNAPNFVEGDRQHFGVVYIGTDGSGAYYGAPVGTEFAEDTGEPEQSASVQVCTEGTFIEDQPLLVQGGVLYVPVRSFFEHLGAEVYWDSASGAAYVTRREYSVEISSTSAASGIVQNQMELTKDGAVFWNGMDTGRKAINPAGTIYMALEDIQAVWNLQVQHNTQENIYYVYNKGIVF